jgi:hypothetical protein
VRIIVTKRAEDLEPGEVLATSDGVSGIVAAVEEMWGECCIRLRDCDSYVVPTGTPVCLYVRSEPAPDRRASSTADGPEGAQARYPSPVH